MAVPLPGGSSFPSEPTILSQARNSASVGALPILYVGDCALAAPNTSRAIAGSRKLDFDIESAVQRILHAPVSLDSPWLNRIVEELQDIQIGRASCRER